MRSFSKIAAVALLPGLLAAQSDDDLRSQVARLTALVQKLQSRVDEVEARLPAATPPAVPARAPAEGVAAASPPGPVASTVAAAPQSTQPAASNDQWHGTTFNVALDTYYAYNFNAPIGRANLLRAYDVSSNSFTLSQADVVIDHPADPANGQRWGLRVDLQFGQATQSLQGNAVNEPRPDIYRDIFQAYGTYVIPVGNGITVDFGKWSSSIGLEGNYTKDQINYSRSFLFTFLPYYHMGARVSYKPTKALTLNYWVTNGTQQTEAYNGYKDELVGFNLQPRKNFNWTVNYYLGQEHPDVEYFLNGGAPAGAPTNQGVPFEPIANPPKGHLDIFDSYFTWQATPKLTLALEGDWVIERLYTWSPPQHTDGGAFYVRYQLLPKFALAARTEYLSDRGGLFSGSTQALKEATLTTEYQFGEGFLMRWEWRRDFSNYPEFYTSTPGILSKGQTTASVGLVWWFGGKQGAW